MTFRNYLTLTAGLLLAAISLFFSATGLIHLFAGAGLSVAIMAIAFEISKISITVYLLGATRQGDRVLRICLGICLVVLVMVSSVGIYGYLGKAYNAGRMGAIVGGEQVAHLEAVLKAQIENRGHFLRQIYEIPAEHSTNRRRLMRQVQPEIDRLTRSIDSLTRELGPLKTRQVATEHDIGELRFAAALFGTTGDGIAKWLISALAFMLDPLAVMLVMASGVKGRKQEVETEVLTDEERLFSAPPPPPQEAQVLGPVLVPMYNTQPCPEPNGGKEPTTEKRLDQALSPALTEVIQRRKGRSSAGAAGVRAARNRHPRGGST